MTDLDRVELRRLAQQNEDEGRGGAAGASYRQVLALLDALDEAERERDDLDERLAAYLCDSTGGLLSKTGYDVRAMVTHTEEYYDKVHAEDRAEIEKRAEVAEAALERVRSIAEHHGVKQWTDEVFAALAPVTEEGDKDAIPVRPCRPWHINHEGAR